MHLQAGFTLPHESLLKPTVEFPCYVPPLMEAATLKTLQHRKVVPGEPTLELAADRLGVDRACKQDSHTKSSIFCHGYSE